MRHDVKKPDPKKSRLDPEEVVEDLKEALYFANIGHPYDNIPQAIRRALKLIRKAYNLKA
jgi:hypothetical protein